MTNKKSSELIGKVYSKIFPDKAEHIRDTDKLCIDYGKSVEYIDRFIANDGLERDWIVHKFPLPQSNGKVFVGAFALDYTKLLRADQSIRESESRFRHMFDQNPEALFIEDENGYILEANIKAGEMQRMPLEDLIGKNMLDFVPEHKREEVKKERKKGGTERKRQPKKTVSGELPLELEPRRLSWLNICSTNTLGIGP